MLVSKKKGVHGASLTLTMEVSVLVARVNMHFEPRRKTQHLAAWRRQSSPPSVNFVWANISCVVARDKKKLSEAFICFSTEVNGISDSPLLHVHNVAPYQWPRGAKGATLSCCNDSRGIGGLLVEIRRNFIYSIPYTHRVTQKVLFLGFGFRESHTHSHRYCGQWTFIIFQKESYSRQTCLFKTTPAC